MREVKNPEKNPLLSPADDCESLVLWFPRAFAHQKL
jgi:hypothetical protein